MGEINTSNVHFLSVVVHIFALLAVVVAILFD